MKTRNSRGLFLTVTITAVLVLAARNVPAQDSTTSAAPTAPVQLSYGVSQIVQLSKAKVSEDTIVNYIRNSGSSYGMDANQIVYLKQQGVSDAVVNTMLSQPRQVAQAAPPPAYPAASSTATATATVVTQPEVTYVQPAYVPSSSVYVIPDTQTYRYYNNYYYQPSCGYYPYYGGWNYPAVSFSFGFGGGYRGGYYGGGWGGGYRGGYSGGYHGGGGGWHR